MRSFEVHITFKTADDLVDVMEIEQDMQEAFSFCGYDTEGLTIDVIEE